MKIFKYKLSFSPYSGELKAKNKKDALNILNRMFKEYDLNKVLQYLD